MWTSSHSLKLDRSRGTGLEERFASVHTPSSFLWLKPLHESKWSCCYGSSGQQVNFFCARNTNRMYRTTCFARNVTSSLPFKVRFRSHCTLERSKPLLIRPVPQDHLGRWSSGAVQKSTSWTTLTVLTHLRTAPEERVLVRPLQRSEWERCQKCPLNAQESEQ